MTAHTAFAAHMRLAALPTDGHCVDVAGERAFIRGLAAAVIERAILDLQLQPPKAGACDVVPADAVSALNFLFGPDDLCAGWAGVLNITTSRLRRGVMDILEAQQTLQYTVSEKASAAGRATADGNAATKRRAARIALVRIRAFTRRPVFA